MRGAGGYVYLPTAGKPHGTWNDQVGSCEPEREAAIAIRLQREKAEALRACIEVEQLELELKRRRLLLQKGELGPFVQAV